MSGHAGVDFFFVLSGFIILYIHYNDIGKGFSLKYFLNRITRIYPIYWIVLIPSVALYLFKTDIIDMNYLIHSIFLIAQDDRSPLVIVAWTLTHEVFFYLIFSFVLFSKRFGWYIIILWQLLILLNIILDFNLGYPLKFILSPFNIEFGMGMLVAYSVVKHRDSVIRYGKYFLVVGVVLFVTYMQVETVYRDIVEYYLGNPEYGKLARLFYGTSSMFIILGLSVLHNKYASSYFIFLGGASYAIYLIHNDIMTAFIKIHTKLNLGIEGDFFWLYLISLVTLFSIFFYVFIEKNLNKYIVKPFKSRIVKYYVK